MGLKVSNDLFGMTVKKLSLYWAKEATGAQRSGNSQSFKTTGIWKWSDCQPYEPAAFNPRWYLRYSFLLQDESILEP